jgi:hypothetical protein
LNDSPAEEKAAELRAVPPVRREDVEKWAVKREVL